MVLVVPFCLVEKSQAGAEVYPSEKYEFVSWDDDIPNKKRENVQVMFQENHQPDYHHQYPSIIHY